MCGIFGVILGDQHSVTYSRWKKMNDRLFKFSESRGQEAAGLAIATTNAIYICKDSIPSTSLIKSKRYEKMMHAVWSKNNAQSISLIANTRLVTDGLSAIIENNQPLVLGGDCIVHNGIIVNHNELWKKYNLTRCTQVDTEILLALMRLYRKQGFSVAQSVKKLFSEIEGEASVAFMFDDLEQIFLATNTGSIYYVWDMAQKKFVFASEKHILKKTLRNSTVISMQLKVGSLLSLNVNTTVFSIKSLQDNISTEQNLPHKDSRKLFCNQKNDKTRRENLRRCTRCILPATMPHIKFDNEGVCNYCHGYYSQEIQGNDVLLERLSQYRKNNGEPDCIVCLSGGRDSSYGLHLMKEKFGMNPIAYSYDWGMITDLARRNQSRLCSKLGVEHIWVSADIQKKRANIQSMVRSWIKNPKLGMVPIFMAGDKQYFFHANQLRKKLDIELIVMCENRLESTDFKTGFCGIKPKHNKLRAYELTFLQKTQLLLYYLRNFIYNPKYINAALLDTLFAYISYYFISHDYLFLYHYYPWDEDEINSILVKQYGWELSPDTQSTWRIGDGTAAFYNYIYYTVAGFTEFDTFRSNQIREGIITREEALSLVEKENQPRFESIREYTQLIDIDFRKVLRAVNEIPKHY